MGPGTIFFKTDQGRAEIAGRSANLTAVQRRLLIVVDGKKTVADLGTLVRTGELSEAIEHLHQLGLIEAPGTPLQMREPVAPGYAAAVVSDEPRAATSPEHFNVVRQGASDFVRERLGSSGEPICAAIDRCSNPEELRKLLRGVEIFIGKRLDAQTIQTFARYFGNLLL
jgi:hypothetical protein